MHLSSLRCFRIVAVIALIFAFLPVAPRGAAAQDATAFISNLGTQAIQVLGPSVPQAQRAARFRQLFESDFDLPEIGRFVLGPYGRALSPEQQQEFQHLFREYLVQAYSQRLSQYGGAPFRVTGTRPYGGELVVSSQVQRQSGNPIQLEWHVINQNGRFLVTDVVVDGVSMKATQRSEFASIIQRNGGHAEALLASLRQQLGAPVQHSGSSYRPPMPGAPAYR